MDATCSLRKRHHSRCEEGSLKSIVVREKVNDAVRLLIDQFISACALLFRCLLFVRVKTYDRRQARLRREYGIRESTAVHSYDACTRDYVESRYRQLGPGAVYAYTSGSTNEPKKIAYDRKRLRNTRLTFIDVFFRYLAELPRHRTLFIFSSIQPEKSLTHLLLQESGLPLYVSGLQAPHRVQNHPAIRVAARKYGETAVRLWILVISNPCLLYATNPSTIANFFHEIHGDWQRSRQLVFDYVNRISEISEDLNLIHRRIASRGSCDRLKTIANSSLPLSVIDLIPALRGYSCWDGGYVGPFLDQIRKYLPPARYRHLPMYSMSTETIETVAYLKQGEPFFLPVSSGVYYEFIEEGKEDTPASIIGPADLIAGKTYSMVVSDGYGLRRYQTEDLFGCGGKISGIPDLRFVRRRNLSYSFTGEKLTAEQLKLAYRDAESRYPDARNRGFLTCFPSKPPDEPVPCYRLILVRTNGELPAIGQAIAALVEQKLTEFNPEYKSKVESRRLGRMRLECVTVSDFIRRVSGPVEAGHRGSQFKFLPLYTKLWETVPS